MMTTRADDGALHGRPMSNNGEVEYDGDSYEGQGEIVRDDIERKRQLWLEDLERWFQNGPDDPEVVLIKVSARHIDAWTKGEDRSFDLPAS
ncbi:MAG: pyridoxamine 5'-phosphate oxidase family protein [Chloroflexota bacterium]